MTFHNYIEQGKSGPDKADLQTEQPAPENSSSTTTCSTSDHVKLLQAQVAELQSLVDVLKEKLKLIDQVVHH